jgi:hypothetical protein
MKLTFSDQPVAYVNAVKAILATIVILGIVTLTGEQVASIVVAVEAVFGIVLWSSVTPNKHVEEKVTEAETLGAANKELEIRQYLETVKPVVAAKRVAAAKRAARGK